MSVKARIGDGSGSDREVVVTPAQALLVQVLPDTSKGVPPQNLSNLRFLTEFFTNSAGSSDQRVNGSVTPVEFAVRASPARTKWITSFRLVIEADGFEIGTADFRDYGAAASPGLANGLQIVAVQGGISTLLTAEPVRTAGDFLDYATSFVNFVNAITAQSDYLQLDFVLPTPVVLTDGSDDRLLIRVRDNLLTALVSSGTARQYALARGYQESV